jgi:hypothetical protein
MDALTHVFLPLTLIYVVRRDFNEKLFPLALFAVLPDFDVFTGIHRGLFHSLVFLAPLSALIIGAEYAVSKRLRYSPIALFFLYSHLALDFLAEGVPFLYPFVELGVGVEFPFVIKFGGSVSIVDVMPKLVYCYPQPVHGEVNAFSSFGVARPPSSSWCTGASAGKRGSALVEVIIKSVAFTRTSTRPNRRSSA